MMLRNLLTTREEGRAGLSQATIFLCLLVQPVLWSVARGEPEPLGRTRLIAELWVPLGHVDELVLTRVGWEDLLDRSPLLSVQDLPRLRHELRVNPSPRDYGRLVRLLYRVGRSSTAARESRKALLLCEQRAMKNPQNPELRRELGLACVNLRQYTKASEELAKALELGRKRADTFAAYSMACLSLGEVQAARAIIDKALEKFSYMPEVLVAAHYVKLNENCRSGEALAKAVSEEEPQQCVELLALEELRQASELDPDYLAVRRTLGSVILDVLWERSRRHSGAMGTISGLRALEQDGPLLEEATAHLDYVLQRDPLSSALTIWQRAAASILAGEIGPARELCKRALAAHFERPQATDSVFRSRYVSWLAEKKDRDALQGFLTRDAARLPTLGDLSVRAFCAWQLGRVDETDRLARELMLAVARPLSPDERRLRAAAHSAQGAVALARGNLYRAVSEYRASVGWSRKLLWSQYGLSVSQYLLGENGAAVMALEPSVGLFRPEGPDERLFSQLAGEGWAKEQIAKNREAALRQHLPAEGAPEFLHAELDWLIGFLSLWRSAGPQKAAVEAAAQRTNTRQAVERLVRYWPRPGFPEPRLDLLAAARLAAHAHPDEATASHLLAEVRQISDVELAKLEVQPFPEGFSKRAGTPGGEDGALSSFPDPYVASLKLFEMATAAVAGCESERERAHALATWLTLRPRLELSAAQDVEGCLERLLEDPRARFTPDENAALLIAGARAIGMGARYAQLPKLARVELSAPSCAAFVLPEGLLLSAPGLGVWGGSVMGLRMPPSREAAALHASFRPGPDRLERCRRSAELFPGSARIQLALSEVLLNRDGGAPSAAARAARAAQLMPHLLEAHIVQGAALEKLGKRLEADAALRKAIRLNPFSETPYHIRGLILAQGGRFAAAATEFQAALEIRPHNLDARSYLAACLSQVAGAEQALAEVRTVLLQDDARQKDRMLLLDLLYSMGRKEEMVLELEELLAAQPGNKMARKFLVQFYQESGKDAELDSLGPAPKDQQ